MFRSGFLIFIYLKEQLISINSPIYNLSNLYRKLLVNNKIHLINNRCEFINRNALRFILIKLGIMYKEIFMIEVSLSSIQYFDLKIVHLLMQYILGINDFILIFRKL